MEPQISTRRGRRWAVSVLGALMVLAVGCGDGGGDFAQGTPQPLLVDRPPFSGSAAYAHVETQVGFGPRVPGTEGHAAQLEWMVENLNAWADTVYTQEFEWTTQAGETLQLTNVMARFLPDRSHRILLLAHWDTRPWADQAPDEADRALPVPGANDGGSGVAVLMELARMMSEEPPATGIDILFVDGEDYGPETDDMFLGARHYAANPLPPEPAFGVLLDMVGDVDPLFPIEGHSAERAPQVAQRVWGIAARLGLGRYFPTRVGGYVSDDHIPLNDAGIPTIDIIDFSYGPGHSWWHTLEDTPDKVSPQTLGMVGEVVTELVFQGG
jgi:Zn-dependent M28 family amino/carboxypeptidase